MFELEFSGSDEAHYEAIEAVVYRISSVQGELIDSFEDSPVRMTA